MNELKERDARELVINNLAYFPNVDNMRVYLKSDVDKVIADKDKEIHRLKWALWIARAYRSEAKKNYWYARSCHEGDERLWSIDGSAVKYIGCIKRTNFDWLKVWSEVESKCLKKAEEYK